MLFALLLAGCGGGAFAEPVFETAVFETADAAGVFEIEVSSRGSGGRTPVVERQKLIVLLGRDGKVESTRTYRYVGSAELAGEGVNGVETEIELGVRIGLSVTEEGALAWSASWSGLQGRPRSVRTDEFDIELPSIAEVRAEGRTPAGTGFELILPSPWPGDPERLALRNGADAAELELELVCEGDPKRFLLPSHGRVRASRLLLRSFLGDYDVEIAQSAGPFMTARADTVRTGIDVEIRDGRRIRWTHSRIDGIQPFTTWFMSRPVTLELIDLTVDRNRLLFDGSEASRNLPPGPGGRPNSLSIRRVSR